jgi:hypothetical protein
MASKVRKPKKPIRTILSIGVYRIEGLGTRQMGETGAPHDMLRYDRGFQHREQHDGARFHKLVTFITYRTKDGTHKGAPTVARWASFIIAIRQANDGDLFAAIKDMGMHPDDWITYNHTTGYTSLVPQTYREFCERTES